MLKKETCRKNCAGGVYGRATRALRRRQRRREFKRWSVGRKRAVVLRLLRGESIDAVSRKVGVTIAELE
ncbi:MAG: hypothetical protein VB137_01775 [Burkholderia sp.]